MLSENIDWKAIHNEYAATGYVRIENIIRENECEKIHNHLVKEVPWGVKFIGRNGPVTIARDELQSMRPEQLNSLQQEVRWAINNKGMSYFYFTCGLDQLKDTSSEFVQYIMGEEFVGFIKYVTGNLNINGFDGQAACYRPNCFLTTHHDEDVARQRKTAFVFGFTKIWRMEWGGLLHMLDDNMNIIDVFQPSYNTLTLFKVPTNHFVSNVAPYASPNPEHNRYTITGWYMQK